MFCHSDRNLAAVWQRMERASYNSLMVSAFAPRTPAASQHAASDNSGFGLRAGCVLILAAILFFARLGARALWSSEFRWAEIAREMIVTHNYFWPTINGHVYYDNPLRSNCLLLF